MLQKEKDINLKVFSVTCIVTVLILINGAFQLVTKQAQIEEVESEKELVENNLEKEKNESQELLQKVDILTEESAELADKIESLSEEIDKTKKDSKETKEKKEKLKSEKQKLENEKIDLLDKLSKKESEPKNLVQLSSKTESPSKPVQGAKKTTNKPKEVKYSGGGKTVNAEATYYIAMCDTGCTGITATGVDVRGSIYHEGMRVIAVDPNTIPLYSIVEVTVNGSTFKAIALDTGGDIKGNRIDILVGSTSEARKLGRNSATVKILRSGKGK